MNNNDIIPFNSHNEHFILSNMYPVHITYKGITFFGVDHLFHYLLYYRHPDIQKRIMWKCKGICANYQAKKISEDNKELIKEITPSQQIRLLKKCMRLKYQQSEHCLKYLLQTEGNELIEFAYWGDTFWGCVFKDRKYHGENHTGKILMELREELRS